MNICKTLLLSALLAACCACGNKQSETAATKTLPAKPGAAPVTVAAPESAEGTFPEAPQPAPQAAAPAASPAAYFKDIASDKEKAKAAREAQEKAQQERQKILDQMNSSSN